MATKGSATVIAKGTGGARAPDVLGDLGTISLSEIDPPASRPPANVIARLTGAVIVTAGYGGWSRVARPRRKAITEWVGRDSMSLEVPFLFDVFADVDFTNRGQWLEEQIRNLERLAGIDAGDPEPPLCEVTSNPAQLIPHNEVDASQVDWFVESITWDRDSTIHHEAGNRLRSGGTFVLTQHVADEDLAQTAVASIRVTNTSKGARKKAYTVRAGDTLSKIAARKDTYHDASKWRKIAEANGLRDVKIPKKYIGKTLKIP